MQMKGLQTAPGAWTRPKFACVRNEPDDGRRTAYSMRTRPPWGVMIWPTRSLICLYGLAPLQNYFCFPKMQLSYSLAVVTGGVRKRHGRGAGCDDAGALKTSEATGRPKSCGPDVTVMRQVWWGYPQGDGGKRADHGEITNETVKPLRGEDG